MKTKQILWSSPFLPVRPMRRQARRYALARMLGLHVVSTLFFSRGQPALSVWQGSCPGVWLGISSPPPRAAGSSTASLVASSLPLLSGPRVVEEEGCWAQGCGARWGSQPYRLQRNAGSGGVGGSLPGLTIGGLGLGESLTVTAVKYELPVRSQQQERAEEVRLWLWYPAPRPTARNHLCMAPWALNSLNWIQLSQKLLLVVHSEGKWYWSLKPPHPFVRNAQPPWEYCLHSKFVKLGAVMFNKKNRCMHWPL